MPPRKRFRDSRLRKQLDDSWRSAKWAALRWLYQRQIAAVRLALAEEPSSQVVLKYPDIPLKPVRSYLLNGLKRRDRPAAVIGHYRAVARILTAEAVVESHTGSIRLLSLPTKAGDVTVDLQGQAGLYREAECRLVLSVGDRPIVEMGLAIVERRLLRLEGSGEVLWIGVLKTVFAGEHGLEDSRSLTKALDGLRPKALLLMVAQVLVRAFNLSGLYAASNKGHVFAGDPTLRRRVKADYDSFWLESGGKFVRPTIFELPLVKAQRNLTEYKPNKRAQIRRRHLLEQEICGRLRDGIAPLLMRGDSVGPQ